MLLPLRSATHWPESEPQKLLVEGQANVGPVDSLSTWLGGSKPKGWKDDSTSSKSNAPSLEAAYRHAPSDEKSKCRTG
jgi:hypothetical protein